MKQFLFKLASYFLNKLGLEIHNINNFNNTPLGNFLIHLINSNIIPSSIIYINEHKGPIHPINQIFSSPNLILIDSYDLNRDYNTNDISDPSKDKLDVNIKSIIHDKIADLQLFKDSKSGESTANERLILFINDYKNIVSILNGCKEIYRDTNIIFITDNNKHYKNSLEKLNEISKYLGSNGFILYDILNNSLTARETVYVYANKRCDIINKYRFLKARSEKLNINYSRYIKNEIKDCLILGSGRSGTSMLGGICYQAGYYMGENLYLSTTTSPKGYFESSMINYINEDILSYYSNISTDYVIDSKYSHLLNMLRLNFLKNPKNENLEGWLSSIPVNIDINKADDSVNRRIKELTKRSPFCYKDPRFSYTLPVWKKFLKPDTVFVCVFREPNITVKSIIKASEKEAYLKEFEINEQLGYRIYENVYGHVLIKNSDIIDNIFFVHYNQILDGTALPKLSKLLGVELTDEFVDRKLKRTISNKKVPENTENVYNRLCELANYCS